MPSPADEKKRQQVEELFEGTKRSFPDVPVMATHEARSMLTNGEIVVVDARSPKEQQVSMVSGAVTLQQFDDHRDAYEGKTVVTYCTVGHRSGTCARSLIAAGWNAFNLDGSILGWTHAGGELADANGPTLRVHVYARQFDLLPEGYEAVW